jgi:hypothetical protein
MKRVVSVRIDCSGRFCDDCRFVARMVGTDTASAVYCVLYPHWLRCEDGKYERLATCICAEAKE